MVREWLYVGGAFQYWDLGADDLEGPFLIINAQAYEKLGYAGQVFYSLMFSIVFLYLLVL